VTLLLFAVSTGMSFPGDLEPPGPPEPTMKTLEEVEARIPIYAEQLPLEITESGSYYLAENAEGTTWGIKVTASDVNIDLNGFSLYGGSGTGIEATVPRVVVHSGIVRNWGSFGILLADDSIVRQVVAEGNGGMGIQVGWESLVASCTARNNGTDGIKLISGLIHDCVASENTNNGVVVMHGAVVRSCVANLNDRNGFWIGEDSLVFGNTAYSNGSNTDPKAGIHCEGSRNRVEGNTASMNDDYGFRIAGCDNAVVRNSAAGNKQNYDIDACNDAGPIGDAASATSPWANISN